MLATILVLGFVVEGLVNVPATAEWNEGDGAVCPADGEEHGVSIDWRDIAETSSPSAFSFIPAESGPVEAQTGVCCTDGADCGSTGGGCPPGMVPISCPCPPRD